MRYIFFGIILFFWKSDSVLFSTAEIPSPKNSPGQIIFENGALEAVVIYWLPPLPFFLPFAPDWQPEEGVAHGDPRLAVVPARVRRGGLLQGAEGLAVRVAATVLEEGEGAFQREYWLTISTNALQTK